MHFYIVWHCIFQLEDGLEMEENYVQMAKVAQPDITHMDRQYGEMAQLDKNISIQVAKLAGGGVYIRYYSSGCYVLLI